MAGTKLLLKLICNGPRDDCCMSTLQVLRKIGVMHFSLSAGLVTGGKRFDEEQNAISRMNILIATPGRLLQHLEQSPFFNVQDLQVRSKQTTSTQL